MNFGSCFNNFVFIYFWSSKNKDLSNILLALKPFLTKSAARWCWCTTLWSKSRVDVLFLNLALLCFSIRTWDLVWIMKRLRFELRIIFFFFGKPQQLSEELRCKESYPKIFGWLSTTIGFIFPHFFSCCCPGPQVRVSRPTAISLYQFGNFKNLVSEPDSGELNSVAWVYYIYLHISERWPENVIVNQKNHMNWESNNNNLYYLFIFVSYYCIYVHICAYIHI